MPLLSPTWMTIVAVAVAVIARFGWQRRTRRQRTDLGSVSGQWIAEHRSHARGDGRR